MTAQGGTVGARVSIIRCEGYEQDKVSSSVRRAIEMLGEVRNAISPGMKVLLKPNLLSARRPEEGVDTHPEVVRAVARIVKDAGAHVWVGDSPGGYGTDADRVFEVSGMKRMAEEEGLELVKFTASRDVDGFPMSAYALDADVIISIPKLKTHGITTLTAGVKNMFGTLTGLFKTACHVKAPKEDEFAQILAKVYATTRPDLTVLDAVVSMEGDGPASGSLRHTNFIMASQDAVAMDSVLATLVGLEPLDLAVTRTCYEQGLGEADLGKIEIVGDDWRSFVMRDFRLPQTKLMRFLPKAIVKGAASLVKFRVVIDEELCKRCNLCKVSCPVDAITIEAKKCAIDYKKCMSCLCCHEVCPYRAVFIKRNALAKMMLGS